MCIFPLCTVTHEDKRTPEDMFHRTYIAAWLLRLLKTSGYFPESVKTPDTAKAKPSDGELYIGGLILHNLMIIQFNAHEVSCTIFPSFTNKDVLCFRLLVQLALQSQISELAVPKGNNTLAKAKNKFIGGGLYPTISLFNHSCNPGVIR